MSTPPACPTCHRAITQAITVLGYITEHNGTIVATGTLGALDELPPTNTGARLINDPRTRPHPDADQITLEPCGCRHTGDQLSAARAAIQATRSNRRPANT